MRKRRRVFLIDEAPSTRRGIGRLLRAAGLDVLAYESAEAFLSELTEHSTGCIVMDARILGMPGADLQRELGSRHANLPLIFVAANDDPETRRKARELKAAGFFRKPVDGPALLDAIRWALESKSEQ
jgi:FixJ family two-component response regulator